MLLFQDLAVVPLLIPDPVLRSVAGADGGDDGSGGPRGLRHPVAGALPGQRLMRKWFFISCSRKPVVVVHAQCPADHAMGWPI